MIAKTMPYRYTVEWVIEIEDSDRLEHKTLLIDSHIKLTNDTIMEKLREACRYDTVIQNSIRIKAL